MKQATQWSTPFRYTTTTLRNGLIVLAWNDGSARTYANRMHANYAAAKFGGRVWGDRPYYVVMNGLPLEETAAAP